MWLVFLLVVNLVHAWVDLWAIVLDLDLEFWWVLLLGTCYVLWTENRLACWLVTKKGYHLEMRELAFQFPGRSRTLVLMDLSLQ